MLEKEFIPYQESLVLKELGFDEPCISGYSTTTKQRYFYSRPTSTQDSFTVDNPTYSQAFRFFREERGLDCSFEDEMVEDEGGNEFQMWDFFIYKTKQKSDKKVMDFCSNNFETFIESYTKEEAELACLRQLIQIVKNK